MKNTIIYTTAITMKVYSDQIEKIGNQSNTPPPSPYTQESTIVIDIR